MKIIWCMFPEISSMIDRPFCRLGHFLPFYLTNNPPKLKFWKTETKTRRYHHFKQEHQNFWSYAIPFLRYGTWWMKLAFFNFELLFAPLKHLEISPFYPYVPKIRSRWCMVAEILAWRTDWWMNGEVKYKDGCSALLFIKNIWICSSNAFYLESLQSISTRMFDTFDNWDHYFESNLNLELLIKVFFIKRHVTLFLNLLKRKTLPQEIIFVFIWYFIGMILSKNSDQKQGVRKKDKKEGSSYSRGWGVGCL